MRAQTLTPAYPARPDTFALHQRLPLWGLLALGGLFTVLTGPRWGIAALAWLVPVPYLLFARKAHGFRAFSALFGVLLLGYCIQCAIFATPPVPVIAVIGFGPPLALLRFAAIGTAEMVRRRAGEGAGLVAYVAGTVLFDWLGYGVSELGAWMATANSQVEFLSFLQLASIAGLALPGALMAWTAGMIALLIDAKAWRTYAAHAIVLSAALVLGLLWGTLRLDQPLPGRSVSVAAVSTSVGPGEDGMPDAATLTANTEALFQRTRAAAARGARLVVWNEIATLIDPDQEDALTSRAQSTARELGIDIVLAYGVLERKEPVLFDNKYLFISERGAILDTYQKHHPVPGEPSIRGTEPLRVLERPYGRVGGAICYDYDFPALSREHARLGADLVVVPSSDWRGIDPVHTFMARVRGIEGGFAILRSVRWAPSAVFDAHGRPRGFMPATEENDGVMVAQVPLTRISTLATRIGDAPIALSGIALCGAVGLALRRRRAGPQRLSASG